MLDATAVPPKAATETSTPRPDPLDTTTELTARIEAIWDEWRRIEHEERELVRIPVLKGVLRTALIRAQRDAATRALSRVQAIITETMR